MTGPAALSGLGRRRATAVGAALIATVAGASAGVGFAEHGSGFDWDVASVFGTAVGTTLLAVGTLALAYSTWQDVRASQRIAETTSRSLELAQEDRDERLRPAVIGTVTAFEEERSFLSVELHNIGGGPAVRVEVTADYFGPLAVTVEPTLLPWLASQSTFPVALRYRGGVAGTLEAGDFRVRGHYLDRLGRPVPEPILDWLHDELSPTGSGS